MVVMSEIELARKLDSSGGAIDAVVDASENTRSQSGRWRGERGRVRKILRVHSEIETDSLSNPELFAQRSVSLKIRRLEEEIAAGVTDRARRGRGEFGSPVSVEPEIPAAFDYQFSHIPRATVAIRR